MQIFGKPPSFLRGDSDEKMNSLALCHLQEQTKVIKMPGKDGKVQQATWGALIQNRLDVLNWEIAAKFDKKVGADGKTEIEESSQKIKLRKDDLEEIWKLLGKEYLERFVNVDKNGNPLPEKDQILFTVGDV